MNKFYPTNHNRKRDIGPEEPKSLVEDEPAVYEFWIAARLSEQWSDWFDGMVISYDDQGNTLMSGVIADQSALHGILGKVRDLNLILLAILRK